MSATPLLENTAPASPMPFESDEKGLLPNPEGKWGITDPKQIPYIIITCSPGNIPNVQHIVGRAAAQKLLAKILKEDSQVHLWVYAGYAAKIFRKGRKIFTDFGNEQFSFNVSLPKSKSQGDVTYDSWIGD